MTNVIRKIALVVAVLLIVVVIALVVLARKQVPEAITYGISFNTMYAEELGLDPRETYDAFLDELGVRHLRLAAHWPMIEPEKDQYDFSELDYQISRAEAAGAQVILAVGRRLPRWPECHIPDWAADHSWESQKAELRTYIEAVVLRYKDSPSVTHWQVENEPYLALFASEHCGDLDEAFLQEEIELVHALDTTRPVLVTDSGNLGTWFGAYRNGDVFGTSVYVYFWTPELGQFKTALPPWFYRVKENFMRTLFGQKETLLIELSLEPWLTSPISETDIETQYSRMDAQKFDEIIEYARETRYDHQYLWGGEWWYWLDTQGHPEMWERGKELFD